MTATISVVIPTHNRPLRTLRAIESVLGQSYPPIEVIVVDDASDVPLELPADLAGREIVQVTRLSTNRGASGARQAGIEAASAELIAFLDSDDEWLPGKLEGQVAAMGRSLDPHRMVVSCGWEVVDPESGLVTDSRFPRPSSQLEDFCSGCWHAPGSTALVSRQLLAEVGGLDTQLRRLEDLDLFLKLGLAGAHLEVAPVVGARIERGRNASSQDVEPAVDLLRQRYLSPESPLNRRERRRLASWLDVELAVSSYFGKRWFGAANHLTRSWIRVPRTQVQLNRWWG